MNKTNKSIKLIYLFIILHTNFHHSSEVGQIHDLVSHKQVLHSQVRSHKLRENTQESILSGFKFGLKVQPQWFGPNVHVPVINMHVTGLIMIMRWILKLKHLLAKVIAATAFYITATLALNCSALHLCATGYRNFSLRKNIRVFWNEARSSAWLYSLAVELVIIIKLYKVIIWQHSI